MVEWGKEQWRRVDDDTSSRLRACVMRGVESTTTCRLLVLMTRRVLGSRCECLILHVVFWKGLDRDPVEGIWGRAWCNQRAWQRRVMGLRTLT